MSVVLKIGRLVVVLCYCCGSKREVVAVSRKETSLGAFVVSKSKFNFKKSLKIIILFHDESEVERNSRKSRNTWPEKTSLKLNWIWPKNQSIAAAFVLKWIHLIGWRMSRDQRQPIRIVWRWGSSNVELWFLSASGLSVRNQLPIIVALNDLS